MENLPSLNSAICGMGVIIILVGFYGVISCSKKSKKDDNN